jgi:hypothetical protein
MLRGGTNHGHARRILKDVIPELEKVELALFEASKKDPAWEPYFEKLKMVRDYIEQAEKLLRQGG